MIADCGPLKDIKQIALNIPVDSTVALTLSGGMDTALLTYLVALELLETNRNPSDHIKWIFTIPKKDGAELYPDNIIRWINQKLN
jgi:asparagine synthetase B (glutamine-hydrolysing)